MNSSELCQPSIFEDDGTPEHDTPYVVNLQEIDKSSNVDSISNPYQQENGYSRATSQDSAKPYGASGQDVPELMDLDRETMRQYQTVVIADDHRIGSERERSLAMPNPNFAKLPPSPKRKQPLVHHPKDCLDSSAWACPRESHPTNTDGSRTLDISADVAFQAIASDLNKADYRSKEEMELVLKTSVLSLLSANKSRKPSPQDSPCRELADKEKPLECHFCHKSKKTRCDLTYVAASVSLKLSIPRH